MMGIVCLGNCLAVFFSFWLEVFTDLETKKTRPGSFQGKVRVYPLPAIFPQQQIQSTDLAKMAAW